MSLRVSLARASWPILKQSLRSTTSCYLDSRSCHRGNTDSNSYLTKRHIFSRSPCTQAYPRYLQGASVFSTRCVSTYHSELGEEDDDDPDKIKVIKHDDTVVVGFHPKKIYDVVMDVRHYKDFVPYCEESAVISREEKQIRQDKIVVVMRANLMVYFYGYRIPYTSHVTGYTRYNENRVKAVCYDEKLFDHLEMDWTFSPGPTDDHCKMDFHISFAFNNKTFNWLAGYFKTNIIEQMIPAFISRCEVLHGKPLPLPCLSRLSDLKIVEGQKERHKRRPRQ